jgi:hypothetical protein
MEHNAPSENKAGNDAVTTPSDTKRNVPGGLSLVVALLHTTYPANTGAQQS